MRKWTFLLVASLVLGLLHNACAYKHTLKVSNDHRNQFFIENFGFSTNGHMFMNVSNFKMSGTQQVPDIFQFIYFLIRITTIDSTEFLEEKVDFTCGDSSIETPGVKSLNQDWATQPSYELTVPAGSEGLYNLYFINCLHKEVGVSFDLHLDQYNWDPSHGKDYLPVGLSPLPTIYAAFSVAYLIMFVVWIFNYIRVPGNAVFLVHHLMSVLVVLKFLSLLFYAIEQHFVKVDGRPGGWEVAYYIFAVLRTLFFFVIVTLIGTGWSFFKPFLSDKDKKIIMVVVPLQVLDNIAMVIVGASEPGSVGWFTWKDIFRLVDIICCGAVLIPIIWSIKHLREASQIDGKAARNLQKLRLFRQFYLIVVSYIYFTRIIIYLLDATLKYYLIYLGDIFTELATLTFFIVVGFKFMPVKGNPYLTLEEEDAIRMEEMRTADEE